MQPWRMFGIILAVFSCSSWAVTAFALPVSSPPQTATASQDNATVHRTGPIIERDEKNAKKIEGAVRMILAGHAHEAIDKILAPMIDAYQRTYAGNKARIYCAKDMKHARLYLADGDNANKRAGTPHRPITVIGKAWAQAHFAEGYAYSEMKQYANAQSEIEKAIALSPRNSHYTSELAFVYVHQKNWPKALDLYKKAVRQSRLAPANNTHVRCVARRGEGFVLEQVGRLDDASAAYRACLKLNPGDHKSRAELTYIDRLKHGLPPYPSQTMRR